MRIKLALSFVMMSCLAAVGCSAANDSNAQDSVADSEDELTSTAWEKFVGAWDLGDDTANLPVLDHIVFTRTADHNGRHFFADVDTGVRCDETPCPLSSRVEGFFTVTSKKVRLTAVGPDSVGLGGVYKYTLAGEKLSLSRSGETTKLEKRDGTYCAAPSDCNDQEYIHVACAGHAICSDDTQTCGYSCDL